MKLRLVVVGDPAIAAAVRQLQGEWKFQTGAEFEVQEATEKQVAGAARLPGDAAICPSHLLGDFAARKLLAPIPREMLQADAGQWSEIFDLLKRREAAWGKEVLGVPFGSPLFVCYYRADLLRKLGRKPPQTWTEYQQLAEVLAREAADPKSPVAKITAAGKPWYGTVEPLGPGWAGRMLLARTAPYALHRDNYSALFDPNTMEPMVAGPPFVRALEELAAAAKLGPKDELSYDPVAARTAFWQGRCGIAISWPTASWKPATAPETTIEVGFAELPGAVENFNVATRAWEPLPEDAQQHVPLLAAAGRMGVVSSQAEHSEAAFQLLLWLSDRERSPQVSAVSPATTLFRRSQEKSPQEWVEKGVPGAAAAGYATLTERSFQRQYALPAMRMPGGAEYLAALDDAVRSAVEGRQAADKALQEAAAQWKEITKRLGLEQQKEAYLRSLGL